MAEMTDGASTSPASPPATTEMDSEKLQFIEEMTANMDAVQERVLAEILARNADSEYLASKCGLAGATDRATFRDRVPMVTYEDLEPYIRRIADGDRSPILTGSGHPVSEFLTSSGTSGGQRKLMPLVDDELSRRKQLTSLVTPVVNQYVPGLDKKGSYLYFLFVKVEIKTPGGLIARPALTSYFKGDRRRCAYDSCTAPMDAMFCEDAFQSMYAQMVCGLCQRRAVLRIGAAFASVLLRVLIRFFQQHWEQLAADIEAGELSPCAVSDPSVREAVAGILRRPDPELAEFIRAECSKDDCWAGIIRRVWPNAKYIETVVTGSMAQYVPTLDFYSGGLPIVSTMYASSECYFGINLRPLRDPSEVSYTIMPNMAYFEFLPAGGGACDVNQLVELADVEAGREYELVLTSYSGLCRYRVGDVLLVTGFHNAAPEFRFVRRGNVLLSIDSDKTDEAELQHAVERASALFRRRHGGAVAVLDYTSQAYTKSIPGRYVVYWEMQVLSSNGGEGEDTATQPTLDQETLGMCCLEMEEALNAVYRQCRVADGSIGPLEIRVVRSGTFQELMDDATTSHGASLGQYKTPRCVAAPSIINLLDSHVISNHFSPKLPHWSPGERFESTGPISGHQ